MEELSLFPSQAVTTLHFEQQARHRGFRFVAGIDEAGRGPLAGPVVAAAVILPVKVDLPGLTDSKKLTAKQREKLYPQIHAQALAVGIGVASAADIDRLNILQATLKAMQRAVGRLSLSADYLLVDGTTPLPSSIPQLTLKKGDSRSLTVAAASVVAKVVRDRIMCAFDRVYPGYGFATHKGYGSREHLEAIAQLRPCPQHRRSFRGVREYWEGL
jgi:ribonuclease HII